MLAISAGRGRWRGAEGGGVKPHFPSKSALRRLDHLWRASEAHRRHGRAADRHLLPCTPCFVHVEVSGDAKLVQQGSGTPRLYWALQRRAHHRPEARNDGTRTNRGPAEPRIVTQHLSATAVVEEWCKQPPSPSRAAQAGIEHKKKGSSTKERDPARLAGSRQRSAAQADQAGPGQGSGVWAGFGGFRRGRRASPTAGRSRARSRPRLK